MKKLLWLILSVLIVSCTPKIVVTDPVKGDTMIRTMNGNYSLAQFDSMCVADTIPTDLLKWQNLWVVDYETGSKITLYLYFKENGINESVYRVERVSDDSVKINKRVIVE